MPIPDGRLFRNPSRKAIRLLMILAAIFLAAGLPPVFFISHLGIVKGQPMTNFQGACMLCMAIGLPLGVAMLLSALLTIPTARQTDRHLSEFLSGHFLADWTYTPEQWGAFVASEARRFHRAAWIYFGIFMVPSAGIGLFIAWMASATTDSKVLHCMFVLAGAVVVSVPYFALARIYARRHHAQLLAYPKAYIGRNAVYCGGDFNFWGSGMRGLDSARILPGDPPMLEVIIGLSKGAARTAAVIDSINFAALTPTYTSGMKARQVIPIPFGCEAQAQEIVNTLIKPPPSPAPPHPKITPPHVSTPPAAHASKAPATPPTAAMLHHRAHRWWRITAAMLVLGLLCFLLIIPLDYRRPTSESTSAATTIAALSACLFWLLCPVFLIYAIILTLKARSAAKHATANL